MNSNHKFFHLKLFQFLGCIIACQFSGCSQQVGNENKDRNNWYVKQKEMYFGIPVRVSFAPNNEDMAQTIWNYLEKIDEVFNDYKATSEIGQINTSPSPKSIPLSPQLLHAFEKSSKLHGLTNGAFDITIGPLRELWQRAAKKNVPPSDAAIKDVLKYCGMNEVTISNNSLEKTIPEMRFDFGGVVKGIAVDEVIRMLKNHGAHSAFVQIGGEISVYGHSLKDKPHVIGIQNPVILSDIWTSVVDPGKGLSISTSGNYYNAINIDGREYYHIINPHEGYPINTRILSVSVVFPETGKNWLSDGLTTAGAVLGPEKTMSIVEKQGGVALFLLNDPKKNKHSRKHNQPSRPATENERVDIKAVKSKNWDLYSPH